MRKGQIFSIDFLIAMIIVVLIIGTFVLIVEKKNFDARENFEATKLEQKLGAAVFALINTNYSCEAEGSKIMYSIDKEKVLAEKDTLKEKLGMMDYSLQIKLIGTGETEILNEDETGRNIYVIDFDIMVCENSSGIDLNDTFYCSNGTCENGNLKKEKLIIGARK